MAIGICAMAYRVSGKKARVKKQGGISGISYSFMKLTKAKVHFSIKLAASQASGGAEP